MSPSEETAKLSGLLSAVRAQMERTLEAGELAGLPREDVTAFVTAAVKLYAAFAEETDREVAAIDANVSTTEAMVLACAILRAQRMNPFDLALWFTRTAPKAV
jgi:pyrroline-5-carboxylate reductase